MQELRGMPLGVGLVLAFGMVLLAGLALTLPLVVEQAVEAPVSPLGILWMLLIAYLIFTLTLVLQRKQAAWGLSVGMASVVVPLTLALWQWASVGGVLLGLGVGVALFLSLRSGPARAWFSER
jgi:hypothetical protein